MRVATVVAMVLLGAAAPAVASEGRTPAAIEEARTAALGSDFQPTLPDGKADGSRAAEQPRSGSRQARYDTRFERQDRRDGGPLSTLLTMVMWSLVIVGVVLAAVWIGRELVRYSGDAAVPGGAEPAPAAPGSEAAIIDRPLGDADELAARGEFAEAIHTLLLRTMQALAKSASVRIGPASTSREILRRVPLLADAREALAALIVAVELTHFGAAPADAADYARCRQQFHVFATAFRAGSSYAASEAAA